MAISTICRSAMRRARRGRRPPSMPWPREDRVELRPDRRAGAAAPAPAADAGARAPARSRPPSGSGRATAPGRRSAGPRRARRAIAVRRCARRRRPAPCRRPARRPPFRTPTSVDLPAPLWPTSPTHSPARTAKSTPSSARTAPKALAAPGTAMTGGAVIQRRAQLAPAASITCDRVLERVLDVGHAALLGVWRGSPRGCPGRCAGTAPPGPSAPRVPSRICCATQKASVETPGAIETDMVS